MVAATPPSPHPPPILGGDLKISDQNYVGGGGGGGGLSKKLNLGGGS